MVKPEICELMPTDGTLTVQLWREDDYHYLAVFGRFSKMVSLGRHTSNACSAGAGINTLDRDDDF